jgi:hypothetical protein
MTQRLQGFSLLIDEFIGLVLQGKKIGLAGVVHVVHAHVQFNLEAVIAPFGIVGAGQELLELIIHRALNPVEDNTQDVLGPARQTPIPG